MVFWSLLCYKELTFTTKPFTGCTLHSLLIQMKNISLQSSGMRRKQNFEIVFGFKSNTPVLTFTFRFLSSPLFSFFLPHFLLSFILVEKVLRKAFNILGLDERKGRWVLEQDFSWKSSGQCYMVFCPFLWCP